MAGEGVEWYELPRGATTVTCTRSGQVNIRYQLIKSSSTCMSWAITSWSQPDTVAKSREETQWRFVEVELNHSW